MSCICQYFVSSKNRKDFLTFKDHALEYGSVDDVKVASENKESLNSVEVSASTVAAAKAEIWVLRKNLTEAQISIENLENLVKTIIAKQNELLCDMYDLKRQNIEMQNECRMQRDHQTMERNWLMREIHDLKIMLGDRNKLLEESEEKNSLLTSDLQDANEKIYVMGVKFLKLRSSRSKQSSDRSSSVSEKSE